MVSVGRAMMAIMELLYVLIAAAVFAGTWLQAKASLTQLKEVDAESVRTYNDIAEMKKEYQPVLHPRKYRQNQRVVTRLLAEQPLERQRYRRVRSQLGSWTLLWAAALLTLGAALVEAVA